MLSLSAGISANNAVASMLGRISLDEGMLSKSLSKVLQYAFHHDAVNEAAAFFICLGFS